MLEISPTSWTRQLKAQVNPQSEPTKTIPRVRGNCTVEHVATDTKRGENPNTLVAEIGDGTDAINFLLVAAKCPSALRPLIDYLVGSAGDRTDWFEADDLTVGLRVRIGDGDMSGDAARKWVQRARKALIEWQQIENLALIECSPGGQATDGTRSPSRYKVNLLALAAATVEKARDGEFWRRNPNRAMMVAAEEIIEDAPVSNPYKPRFRKPRRDDDAVLRRNPKHAETLLLEVARIIEERGEDSIAWLDTYTARVKQAALVHIKQEKQWTDLYSGQDGKESQGGNVLAVEPEPVEVRDEATQALTDAFEAFDVMSSVGASRFDVTMKDDESGKKTKFEKVTPSDIGANLPDYFMQNASGRESFIVRPRGASLIQVDDCTASERDMLAPFAFLIAETSAENYQTWLALPGGTGDDELKRVHERLFKGALLNTRANAGGNGAMRWTGSFNCKPERRRADGSLPRVRLIAASRKRFTTEAELENNGLLAPHFPPCDSFPPVKPKKAVDTHVHHTPPSYEKCLQSVKLKENGKPDRSAADLLFAVTCFDWKFGFDVTVALLKQVSPKARERRDDYVQRTVTTALRSVRL